MSRFDIVVVGAGPAGLCFARALAGSGLSVAVVERQTLDALASPPDDGREIALTHRSQRLLADLGLWARFADEDIGPLRDATPVSGDANAGGVVHRRFGASEIYLPHRLRLAQRMRPFQRVVVGD